MYLVLSTFTSSPLFLVATTKASALRIYTTTQKLQNALEYGEISVFNNLKLK